MADDTRTGQADPDREWVRGPYPAPEGVEDIKTEPCWGCGRELRPHQVRLRAQKKHPVCSRCYLRGDDYLWTTCEVAGCDQVKKRIRAAESTYVCPQHREGTEQ